MREERVTSEHGLFLFDNVRVVVETKVENGPLCEKTLLDVNIRLPEKSISIVVGPSGSGKTTLLRLCNCLSVPTSGRVLFRGVPLAKLNPLHHRRQVGWVPQRMVPFPGTVRDNLLVAQPEGTDPNFAVLLERCALDPNCLDRVADALSGGELQRLVLCRALATQPEVLLLDEPTSALDPVRRDAIEHTLRTFVAEGGAGVWVTHDFAQARRMGDFLVALVEGRCVFHGAPEAFFALAGGEMESGKDLGSQAAARFLTEKNLTE